MSQKRGWPYIGATGLLVCSSALHASDRLYRNEEYGFQIAVPRDRHVCVATTGGAHAHGLTFNIDKTPKCVPDTPAAPGDPAEILIWADYNAGFATSVYPTWEGCKRSPLAPSLRRELRSRARSWGTCVLRTKDGRIELNLIAMTGSYDRSWGEEAGKPCFHYSMTLRTYPNRFARDLIEFRKFLRQVKLTQGCGTLNDP